MNADSIHLPVQQIRRRATSKILQSISARLLRAIVHIVKICQPALTKGVRQFANELVGAITQRIATVEVEASIRSHIGIWLRIHRKNVISNRVDSACRNLVEWKSRARRGKRIINAPSADAVPVGIRCSNLREITGSRHRSAALQQRRHRKRISCRQRRSLPISLSRYPEEGLVLAAQNLRQRYWAANRSRVGIELCSPTRCRRLRNSIRRIRCPIVEEQIGAPVRLPRLPLQHSV